MEESVETFPHKLVSNIDKTATKIRHQAFNKNNLPDAGRTKQLHKLHKVYAAIRNSSMEIFKNTSIWPAVIWKLSGTIIYKTASQTHFTHLWGV